MPEKNLMEKFDGYGLNNWENIFQSKAVECLESKDRSESYGMNACHVFRLEDGKFAVVVEFGCSCYSSDLAEIELHPTKEKAMEKFREWEK